MPVSERMSAHRAFQRDDAAVMVATVAFGMGIDKPNIRRIIHFVGGHGSLSTAIALYDTTQAPDNLCSASRLPMGRILQSSIAAGSASQLDVVSMTCCHEHHYPASSVTCCCRVCSGHTIQSRELLPASWSRWQRWTAINLLPHVGPARLYCKLLPAL